MATGIASLPARFNSAQMPAVTQAAVSNYINKGSPEELICRRVPYWRYMQECGAIIGEELCGADLRFKLDISEGGGLRPLEPCGTMVCDSVGTFPEGVVDWGEMYFGAQFCRTELYRMCEPYVLFNYVKQAMSTLMGKASYDLGVLMTLGTYAPNLPDPYSSEDENYVRHFNPGQTPFGLANMIGNQVWNPILHQVDGREIPQWNSSIYTQTYGEDGEPIELESADQLANQTSVPLSIDDMEFMMDQGSCDDSNYNLIIMSPKLFRAFKRLLRSCGYGISVNGDWVSFGVPNNVMFEGAVVIADPHWGALHPGNIGFFNMDKIQIRIPKGEFFATDGMVQPPNQLIYCQYFTLTAQMLTVNRGAHGLLLCRKSC